jgi:AI-2 transport protein TqsA
MQYLNDTKIQTLSLMLLALIGLGSLLHITKSFMVPFVIALLFAFLLIPIADFLLKLRIPSILANAIVLAVQFISGSFVEPLIMGDRLNLNIIAILLSLLLWGIIWGIPGMILAVPITASLNIMLSNIKTLRSISILLSK